MQGSRLILDSIGKHFGSRQVLRTASLTARAGEITVIFGRNGSGKSTLMRCACGLLRPDHGRICVEGEWYEATRLHRSARKGMFFLPERDLLSAGRTVRDHLDALRWYHPHAAIDAAVERLTIGPLMERRVRELSGGETRRVEVAIAVARRPGVLLADEPFMGIMPRDAEEFGQVFRELALTGTAIVLTGHEVSQLMNTADHVVWMADGSTTFIGNALDARLHHAFQSGYIGAV